MNIVAQSVVCTECGFDRSLLCLTGLKCFVIWDKSVISVNGVDIKWLFFVLCISWTLSTWPLTTITFDIFIFLTFDFCVGSAWSLGFSSRRRRISIPDIIHYICFPILILEKEPVVSLLNVQCLTRALLVPFL